MGIGYVTKTKNKILEVQKILKGIRKFCTNFPELYKIRYPKLEAFLKIRYKSWEKGLALVKDDHWLVETWKLGLDHRKEVLERVLHEVELDIDWVKEMRVDYAEYLKMMTDLDVPASELDAEKLKPYFHKKMDNMTVDVLMPYFMGFVARSFAQSKQVVKNMPNYDKDWYGITSTSRRLKFQVIESDILEWNKLQALILKFIAYSTVKKSERNPIIDDEFLTK